MCKRVVIGGLMLFLVHAVPSPAAADWLLTPYIGGTLFDIPDSSFRPSVGGSFLWSGPIAGVELDVSVTPDFLEGANTVAMDKSSLFSLMGNAVVQFPTRSKRVRPYVVAGVGLMHTSATTVDGVVDSSRSHYGFNAGGGLTAFLSPRVGLRGDVRYFRAVQGDEAAAESKVLGLEPVRCVRAALGLTLLRADSIGAGVARDRSGRSDVRERAGGVMRERGGEVTACAAPARSTSPHSVGASVPLRSCPRSSATSRTSSRAQASSASSKGGRAWKKERELLKLAELPDGEQKAEEAKRMIDAGPDVPWNTGSIRSTAWSTATSSTSGPCERSGAPRAGPRPS
jgi:hypothetical protein